MTWRDLIKLTLEDIGVYGQAQTMSPNDEDTARLRLNDFIDMMKIKKFALYNEARTTWPLTTTASYPVGSGSTVNVARPPSADYISGLSYVDTSTNPDYEYPMGPPITEQQWRGIAFKDLQAIYPTGFYYDNTYPLGALKPYPIPTGSNLLGVMYSATPVVEEITAPNLASGISMPPGYRMFIRLGLMIAMAPAFRKPIDPQWRVDFKEACAAIGVTNEVLEEMSTGVAGALFGGRSGKSNIYTGEA